MVSWSQDYVRAFLVMQWRLADQGHWGHSMTFDMHADIDTASDLLLSTSFVLAQSLVILADDLSLVYFILLSLLLLTQLRDLP